MKSVLLATTNHRKIREASETLAPYDIGVESVSINIDEIQHHDSAEIAKAKARAAYEVVKRPVAIQDTSWEVPALGGFPGGYMKDVAGWWVPEDWMAVMGRHEDRTIFCVEHVVYFDGNNIEHFQARYTGTFVEEPRGNDGDSLDRSVSIHGGKTMAEMHDLGELATNDSDLQHWVQFAEWYKTQEIE